jgi:competence protein ComEA
MNRARFLITSAAGIWLIAVWFGASPSARVTSLSQAGPSISEDAGSTLLVRMCSRCHDAARIVEKRRTRSDWQDVLIKMMERGAEGTEKDFESLFAYLCLTYGQIRINEALPDEMTATLGVTAAEAAAIAAHRSTHGPFADFDAVRKVPGVDTTKLDKQKDAFVF